MLFLTTRRITPNLSFRECSSSTYMICLHDKKHKPKPLSSRLTLYAGDCMINVLKVCVHSKSEESATAVAVQHVDVEVGLAPYHERVAASQIRWQIYHARRNPRDHLVRENKRIDVCVCVSMRSCSNAVHNSCASRLLKKSHKLCRNPTLHKSWALDDL